MGTIGNVEQAGSGSIGRVVALQGGLVFTGSGNVGEYVGLNLPPPQRHGDYRGPVNIDKVTYINMGGWTFKPDGPDLLLCDWAEKCQRFTGTPRP
jgi:hypothetical protein